jgi:37-kD nucleoid-associated bacterial protein
LLFTESQKFYKIAIIIKNSNEDYEIYASDSQVRMTTGVLNANYFVNTFLGCKLSQNAKIQTKNFLETGNEIIMELKIEDEEKVSISNALQAYLLSTEVTVDIGAFSNQFIPEPAVRDEFIEKMSEVNQAGAIAKDLTLVERRLKNQRMTFDNDIKIVGPSENFRDNVQIVEVSDDGSVILKIIGRIKSLGS